MPLTSRKVLTEQLKEQEEDGLICREAFAELLPRVECSLTAHGQALLPILDQLCAGTARRPLRRQLTHPSLRGSAFKQE
jgi:DNA-binding HxlR family transcriptional regulator